MGSTAPHRRSSSFFLPMLLMGKRKRHGLKALYYFCRAVDDAVDEAPSKAQARENLAFWRVELENLYARKQPPTSEISLRLGRVIEQFHLPRQPFEDLLSGMAFDCSEKVQIHTEAELERYCYCVAGTVGLQAMLIFGVQSDEANHFATWLGQALQLTNILRDVEKDARIQRSYLPEEWGEHAITRLQQKAEHSFQQVAELEKRLPSRPLLPALLMRDIYYWKYQRILVNKPPKPLPFPFYLRLVKRSFSYLLS